MNVKNRIILRKQNERCAVRDHGRNENKMKFLIQIARDASVKVDETTTGKIEYGFLVLIGIEASDTKEIADKLIKKMLGLRIFPDENGKTNLNISQVNGELLLVSQFTLYADCRKGNRPSFINAAEPGLARELYEYCIEKCTAEGNGIPVATGIFGADMKVRFLNDGPFTIMLDSKELM